MDADDRAPADDVAAAGAELLAAPAPARVAPPTPARRAEPLFRVVEVVRNQNGRLERHGQIWHHDLDRVRRFGRAVAANSASQQVVVADADGAVVEAIPPAPPGAAAPGWGAWSAQPLPPMPPRPRARVAPKRPARAIAPPPSLLEPAVLPVVTAEAAPAPASAGAVDSTRPLPDNRLVEAARRGAAADAEPSLSMP